ncbi:MAG: hypothetical protein HBSAPP03_07040 [Phycisphaerae bacterium]|nr:MAG: hypothetical protein HBSAPP03_07040 [Phycisphaerae bacterium]
MRSLTRWCVLAILALAPLVRAQDESPEDSGVESPAPPPAAPPPAAPAPDDPGRVLFQKAAEALARAQYITYRVRSSSTGDLFVRTGRIIEADVRQVRQPGGVLPGWRLRLIGTTTEAGGKPPLTPFDVAWLQANVEWVDHAERKIIEKNFQEARRNRAVLTTTPIRLEDMTSYRPFQKELAAVSYTFEDDAAVGGVPCRVLVVAINQGQIRARWHLAIDDHLPRRVERLIETTRSGLSSSIMEFTDMRVSFDPPTPAMLASVRVAVPEGYAEDRPPVPVPLTDGSGGFSPNLIDLSGNPGKPADATTTPVTPPPTTPPAPAGPPKAPPFDLLTPAGEHVTLESLRGQVVVLEFAGSWAVNLRAARPELATLLPQYKDRPVRALALSVRERSKDAAVAHFDGAPAALTLLLNAEKVAESYGVAAFPAYAVVGPAGELLMAPAPFTPDETMRAVTAAVDAALQNLPSPSP